MDATESTAAPRWRALQRNERRVAGVLAEKAKTTPENYPLTINSIVNGCNQKSNRFPQMQLDEEQVSEALDALRHAGAVSLIQGDGRAEKYRHLLYDWLGVEKAELAVMTELLLRGAQTLGELRGRAARMEPIRDMGELQPIVDSLRQKSLVIYLSSPGRGAVVTHNLYQPQELAKVKAEHGGGAGGSSESGEPAAARRTDGGSSYPSPVTGPGSPQSSSAGRSSAAVAPPPPATPELDALREDVASLKEEVADLRREVDNLKQRWEG
jgi:uncharacterized protein YceH (UPF0502 family)